MATKAFQKIYTKISQITKATCSLKASGVGYDELAMVNGKLAQVVKIMGDEVTLQVFEGTEGIPTNAEVVFLGKSPTLKVSDQLVQKQDCREKKFVLHWQKVKLRKGCRTMEKEQAL